MGAIHDAVAESVHKAAETKAQQQRTAYTATVLQLKPFTIELDDSHDIIDEDEDLVLAQHVIWYDNQVGIDVGDTVMLDHRGKHWIVVGILGDKDPPTVTKYKLKNKASDQRTIDRDSFTDNDIVDLLMTLISDLIDQGILKANT